jgi:hypothetical protein
VTKTTRELKPGDTVVEYGVRRRVFAVSQAEGRLSIEKLVLVALGNPPSFQEWPEYAEWELAD